MASTSNYGGDNDGMYALLPGPKILYVDDLSDLFLKAVTQNDVHFVDFSKMGIQPPLAVAIFNKIDEIAEDPPHAIHLNLTENRLGNMLEEQFKAVLQVLEKQSWLCVRFGYEIVPQRLLRAMSTCHSKSLEGRVSIDTPWLHPSNAALAQTMQKLEKLGNLDVLLREITDGPLKKVAKLSEQHHSHVKSVSDCLESETTLAVASNLTHGEVVVTNYKWREVVQNSPGDVDGVVFGELSDGSPVAVICEAKLDIAKTYKDAVEQLYGNVGRVQELIRWSKETIIPGDVPGDIAESDAESDKYVRADASAVRANEMANRRIIVALGSQVFTSDTVKHVRKKMHLKGFKEWMQVGLDGATVFKMYDME